MPSQEVLYVQTPFSARRWLALCGLVTVLILAFLAVISPPQQLPVIAYKAGLVSFAACLGVWIDRAVFPVRPTVGLPENRLAPQSDADGGDDEVDFEICTGYLRAFVVATIRRGIMVGMVILGMCLGLCHAYRSQKRLPPAPRRFAGVGVRRWRGHRRIGTVFGLIAFFAGDAKAAEVQIPAPRSNTGRR